MITAVIAEKPSVAKDIANVLNVRERHDGYLSGNGYLVTWAFGHLVQLAMPEAYGYTGFRRENLPILPQEFKYIPRQIREGKEYKPDLGVLKQLKVIKEVFDRSDRIVVATDAGREGEAIHRYIYNYLGCRKPCLRLWSAQRQRDPEIPRPVPEGIVAVDGGREAGHLSGGKQHHQRKKPWAFSSTANSLSR